MLRILVILLQGTERRQAFAAFRDISRQPHGAERESEAEGDLLRVTAIDLRRTLTRSICARLLGGKPRVDTNRLRAGANLCKRVIGEYRLLSIVHAQSPRKTECCAELGREPSDGESAFPRS